MDYNSALNFIGSFIDFEKLPQYNYASSFKLERMTAILEALGNPHCGLDIIHVAGSKGKGSTCAITAYILKEAGYSAGLYTSPHLIDMRERIRILERCSSIEAQDSGGFEGVIEKNDFVELIERIMPIAETFRDHKALGRISFFEILTACAFLYFKERKADVVILETGLGGRLDATNAAEPSVCGITNISLEHTDKLGNSLKEIAIEKAGIIKNQKSKIKNQNAIISAHQEEEVNRVIRNACTKKKVKLYEIGKDICYSIIDFRERGMRFNLRGPDYSFDKLHLNLIGAHQAENASLAIAMVKCLDRAYFKIDEAAIRRGLEKVSWPGRLEVLKKEPLLILDGAMNATSIKRALSSIKEGFSFNRLICVFGISRDKDIKGVSAELDRATDIVILTKSRSSRAAKPLDLRERFSRPELYLTDGVEGALALALNLADKKDLILVTGSLYVVGEAMERYELR